MKTSLVALSALLAAPVPGAAGPVARSSVVPFAIETSGGNPRPIVTAKFNGRPLPVIVHSNASFFSQLRHARAAAFGVRLTGTAHQRYGIDRAGHVSELGLDRGTVATLAVGRTIVSNAPVSVFEIPQDDLGMLGVGWIRRNRVIMDFAHRSATVAPTEAAALTLGETLRHAGYVGLPMTFDRTLERYTVDATINGVTRAMVVHTASELVIDTGFADAAGLSRGKDNDTGNGPTGTHVANFALAAPITIRIGHWTSPRLSEGAIQDNYGYMDQQRPQDSTAALGGYLGYDFMTKTRAVIDFGRLVLYVHR